MQVTISVPARAVRVAAAAVTAAAAVMALGWVGGQARAAHDPSGATLHVCAAANGALRLAEDCRANETAHVLATESGLQAAEDRIATLESDLAAATGRITDLEADNAALTTRVTDLETTLADVERTTVDGRDTLRFTAMNLQLVNGTGSTNGAPNGLGNLIVGYNEDHTCDRAFDPDCPGDGAADQRTGSHMVVVGVDHSWTSFGGLLAGVDNTASGDWASVSGGQRNTASGVNASVSGGFQNTASGRNASVSGGVLNTASGSEASVSGGVINTASGIDASVSGGQRNTASGANASVSGGLFNTASGLRASILGGANNTVDATNACHPTC